jgi:hypothetical protein
MKFPTLFAMASTSYSAFFLGWIQNGTTSTSPSILKSNDFPYITGNPALGPISPNPRIAVPSVTMTAILLVLE